MTKLGYLCLYICGIILAISLFSLGFAETISHSVDKNGIDRSLVIKNGSISANLKNKPLNQILQHISKKTKIWFQVNKALLDEKVTIEFNELPTEEGIKRILSNLNYSMSYDSKGRLTGLVIIDRSISTLNRPSRAFRDSNTIIDKTLTDERSKKFRDNGINTKDSNTTISIVSKAIPVDPTTIPKRPPGADNNTGHFPIYEIGNPPEIKE